MDGRLDDRQRTQCSIGERRQEHIGSVPLLVAEGKEYAGRACMADGTEIAGRRLVDRVISLGGARPIRPLDATEMAALNKGRC